MAGIANRPTSELFNGQSDIVIGLTELSTSTLETGTIADIVDFFSVGDVVEDTTDFAGDDATIDSILNEQGAVITSSTTAGTIAFTFSLANMSNAFIKFFLNGDSITNPSTNPDFIGTDSGGTALLNSIVGFGNTQGVITRPVGIINAQANKMLLLPKAQIVSSLGFEDTLMVINVTVTAENVNGTGFRTAMIIDGTIAEYDNSGVSPTSLSISGTSLSSTVLGETEKVTTKTSKGSTL